jgi:hypothetical protein
LREAEVELDYDLRDYRFFRKYECSEKDAYPNVKYIFFGRGQV